MMKLTFKVLLHQARRLKRIGVNKTDRRFYLSALLLGARFYTVEHYTLRLCMGGRVRI